MIKEYKKDSITVVWDDSKCIHSGICSKGLSAVFKPKERPWIKVENAGEDEIVEQVNKCPSGALSLK